MPRLLGRIQAQNEAWLRKLPPSQTRFRGVIHPVNPTALPTSVFILPRVALRTRPQEPVAARDLFRDPAGRIMLVADHDQVVDAGSVLSKVFALVQMTELVPWTRREEKIHPVTKQRQSDGPPRELGPIWVSIENYTRGDSDAGIRVTTDRLRCITAAKLQLGDVVRDAVVKRVNTALGVTVAEIE